MEFMEFTFKNQKYGKIHDPGCNFLNDFQPNVKTTYRNMIPANSIFFHTDTFPNYHI